MRILVATNHLNTQGGSESHAEALFDQAWKSGHEATLAELCNIPHGWISLNVALLSHNTVVSKFFDLYPDFPPDKVVQTIHGLVPELEKPYTKHRIQYVAISEEVRAVYPFAKVITQGVDLDRFHFTELPRKPLVLLSLAQSEPFNAMLSDVCKKRGLVFRKRNKFVNPISNIEHEIESADIVVSLGRGVYESMAMGKFVIIADHRSYQPAMCDGVVTPVSYPDLITRNMSGRFHGYEATPDMIEFCIGMYSSDAGKVNRELAEKHHDIKDKVNQYLEMVQ